MSKLSPFFLFDGTCAEAMAFYQSCLGGELTILTVKDSPMKDQVPVALHDRVIHAHLTSGALEVTASDWLHQTRKPAQGNMVCAYIHDATYEELKTYFDTLAEGADPDLLDPLREMPFGAYGALTDKYGVRWMFQGNWQA
jgi:PhnB protein